MKIKHLLNLTAILVFFAIISCEVEEKLHPRPTTPEGFIEYNKFKITIEQGVSGTLLFQEGSCGPVLDTLQCETYPVTRTIRIYELTTREDTKPDEGAFFSEVHTKLVTKVESDKDGFFQVKLKPGKYSMFIEEDGRLYANLTGRNGEILASTVDSGWVTLTNPEITWKAVY
ncbi:MAG TPA: hypothetical protein VIR29_12035 [Anseongella sp.]